MEYGQFIYNVKINDAYRNQCYTCLKTVRLAIKVILYFYDSMHEDVDIMGWVHTLEGPENLLSQPEASCDALCNQKKVKGMKGEGKRPKMGNSSKGGTKK